MKGLLIFNDNHELLFLKGDQEFRNLLKKRQTDLGQDGQQHLLRNDTFDMVTVSYIFLPLVVIYETMKCLKFDKYVDIENGSSRFYFAESSDSEPLILLAVTDVGYDKNRMHSCLMYFLESLKFVFGPLAFFMTHQSMMNQLDLFAALVEEKWRSMDNIVDSDSPTENMRKISLKNQVEQTWFPYVNASALADETVQNALAPSLACLIGQFQAFVKGEICFLYHKNVLLTTSYLGKGAAADGKTTSQLSRETVAKASHITFLSQRYTFSKTSTLCQYCYSIAFRGGPDSPFDDSVFWDVFTLDLCSDVRLVCLTPTTHSTLIQTLAKVIDLVDKLDGLRFEKATLVASFAMEPVDTKKRMHLAEAINKNQYVYDYWLSRLDSQAKHLSYRYDEELTVVLENSKLTTGPNSAYTNVSSSKLTNAFKNTWQRLHVLTVHKNGRPDVTRVNDDAEETSILKVLRGLSSSLLLDAFCIARDEARLYKQDKLDRCWKNMLASNMYQPAITRIIDFSTRYLADTSEGPAPGMFNLDPVAYLFVLPERHLLLAYGFGELELRKQHFLIQELERSLQGPTKRLEFIMRDGYRGHLCTLVSTMKNDSRKFAEKPGILTRLLSPEKKGKDTDALPKEPGVVLCLFEPFINKNLAYKETRELTAFLYRFISQIRVNFS